MRGSHSRRVHERFVLAAIAGNAGSPLVVLILLARLLCFCALLALGCGGISHDHAGTGGDMNAAGSGMDRAERGGGGATSAGAASVSSGGVSQGGVAPTANGGGNSAAAAGTGEEPCPATDPASEANSPVPCTRRSECFYWRGCLCSVVQGASCITVDPFCPGVEGFGTIGRCLCQSGAWDCKYK
jgi:hypothetical protein